MNWIVSEVANDTEPPSTAEGFRSRRAQPRTTYRLDREAYPPMPHARMRIRFYLDAIDRWSASVVGVVGHHLRAVVRELHDLEGARAVGSCACASLAGREFRNVR